ncbi:MAG: hypothetical protein V3W18_12540 [candidate division Zixibacteria bacterium]
MKYRLLTITGIAAAVAIGYLISADTNMITRDQFHDYKMAKRGDDPSKKPSEWFTIQRAWPHDNIPYPAYKRALDTAMEHRQNTAQEIGIWIEAGPTNVGGRITDIAVHPDSPDIIYAGAALGGVLKSTNTGQTWSPVSDAVPSLSVGDIEIDPFDENTLYLGTGESNSSGDSYAGTGIYKTTDGGESWDFMGLPDSRHIGRIVIDPSNNQRIFVAAMGSLFGTNPERGVYRSLDGGQSWEQVLFVSDSTGAADIAINPQNPDVIFAAMWQRIRGPRRRNVGGLNTGIWRSTDGGDNWELLSNGLFNPSSTNGRIGLAVSPADPDYVYASMVNHPGYLRGFWRSTDGGDSWESRLVSPGSNDFSSFGWYFGRIWAHPTDRERVYFGDMNMWRSTDGGANWNTITGSMHVDMHGLFQDPNNPDYMVAGNDGGVFISSNEGNSWIKLYDLPITQFYAITIDKLNPGRLYGGTQDNSTPRTISGDPDDWDVIFYGDGFYTNIDFTNSNVIYAEAQYGYLGKSTNLGQNWNLITDGIDSNERRNWSTPVVMSPHDNNILFFGAQRLYRTVNGGDWWNAISPDLTGGDGGGNLVFGTITTIGQSPLNENVIWAGTDDSRIWVTSNGGDNWELVSDNLPERWCTRVTPDVFDQAAAYVSLSGYSVEDYLPHIFKTTDYGVSWTDITGNLGDTPVNDILPDPENQGRLYAGTDFGVYYSNDDGGYWRVLGENHPVCPIFDMDLHSDSRKLVSGTHGRSMYMYDLTQLDIACDYLPGDVNASGLVNGEDVVYLVNFLKGEEAPPDSCICGGTNWLYASADVDGDCEIDGEDTQYLIEYLKGGPEPVYCPDCPPGR